MPANRGLGAVDGCRGRRLRPPVGLVGAARGVFDLQRRGRRVGVRTPRPLRRPRRCRPRQADGRRPGAAPLRQRAGVQGLAVVPWLWQAPPTDRRYYALYAACVELGVPFCTQGGHTGPLRASETGRPIPYIDQVALDFPELTIVCGHIGYPWTEEMVAVARKHENVFIDTSAYTTKRYPPELPRYMTSRGGRRKVMFGSNYPMIAPEAALADLETLQLDDETRELFLADNARRIFALAI